MHLVPNNPAHTMQVFSNANTLPTPRYFNFTTIDPNAMEGYTNISGIVSAYEGAYVVISNVFLGITNASPTLVVDETIFATNLTGQVFTLRVPNNALTQPFGGTLSGNFAKSIKGALAQFQGSGTVLTNNYSIYLDLLSNIEYGTPPAPQSPPPTISSTVNSGGNLVFSGTNNNTSGGQTYFVLTSTNVGLSLSNWTVLSTNTFNADGTFSVTNPVGTGGQQFFLLQVP
jgi:hypothetical protein